MPHIHIWNSAGNNFLNRASGAPWQITSVDDAVGQVGSGRIKQKKTKQKLNDYQFGQDFLLHRILKFSHLTSVYKARFYSLIS